MLCIDERNIRGAHVGAVLCLQGHLGVESCCTMSLVAWSVRNIAMRDVTKHVCVVAESFNRVAIRLKCLLACICVYLVNVLCKTYTLHNEKLRVHFESHVTHLAPYVTRRTLMSV